MPKSEDEIRTEFQRVGYNVVETAIRKAAEQLYRNEKIVGILYGKFDKSLNLFIATETRALAFYIDEGGIFSETRVGSFDYVYYNDTAHLSFSFTDHRLELKGYANAGNASFGSPSVSEEQYQEVLNFVQDRINLTKSGISLRFQLNTISFVDALERLVVLHEKGLLNAEEFELAKRKLLSS